MELEKITKLRSKMQELRKEMQDTGKVALQEAFQDFFKTHPEAESIYWTQFTMYFNDGDTCHFSVYDMNLELTEEGAEKLGTSEIDEWGYSSDDKDSDELKTLQAHFTKFTEDVKDDELFELVFGDHVKITATRDGIQVDDYTHHD